MWSYGVTVELGVESFLSTHLSHEEQKVGLAGLLLLLLYSYAVKVCADVGASDVIILAWGRVYWSFWVFVVVWLTTVFWR